MKIGGHLVDPVDDHMGRLDMRRMSYVQRMSKYLGRRMWDAAGQPEVDPDRFAVVIGTGLGGGEKIVETYDLMNEGGPEGVAAGRSDDHAQRCGRGCGPGSRRPRRVITPVSACSSGSEAIAHAWRQIVMVTPTSPSAAVSRA